MVARDDIDGQTCEEKNLTEPLVGSIRAVLGEISSGND
jgi:hypothetical protein